MDESMCKIYFEALDNNKGKGSGFFCKINFKFPIKYALFTNNHVLNETNLEIGKTIKLEYLELIKNVFSGYSKNIIKRKIEITEYRKIFTNKELDYTCIELFESDGINNYFEIEPNIFKHNNNILKNNDDIFILQYINGNDLSFSYGKILSLKGNKIIHTASTESWSSGSPIIKKCKDNYIIGLHFGGVKNNKNEYKFNLATTFDSILDNIKEQLNEILCIYIPNKNNEEINLLHDYNLDVNNWENGNMKKEYLEAKNINKKFFEENIDIFVDSKKINFKYKIKESKKIKVKFKFRKLLTNASFMFKNCSTLKSIDLSLFNITNINDMSCMFGGCSSLKTINLSSFNTTNVIHMSCMFGGCSSLKTINLSSFNTTNLIYMNQMFYDCSSLISIDLSSFNTTNVIDMKLMFYKCSSLKSIDLSSFNTTNVNNMNLMFAGCSSLKSIDLSSFNTTNVNNMRYMFGGCSSLNSIDLSSFNTTNAKMCCMFSGCSSLKKENIKINNNDEKLLNEINENLK